MRINLDYGITGLDVNIPAENVAVLAPRFVPGLPDERAAFVEAVRSPRDAPPLRECVRGTGRVAIVIPDSRKENSPVASEWRRWLAMMCCWTVIRPGSSSV